MTDQTVRTLRQLADFAKRGGAEIDHIRVSLHNDGKTVGFTAFATEKLRTFALGYDVEGSEDCPPEPNTQTTPPDRQNSAESVTLWAEVSALEGVDQSEWDNGYHAALDYVLAILTRRGFTEAADANPEKQAVQRILQAEGYNPPKDAADAPSGDIFPSRLPDTIGAAHHYVEPGWEKPTLEAWREAIPEGFAGVCIFSIKDGVVDASHRLIPQTTPDPTPEDQRTMFEQLIAEGRPTTVEVKDVLDRLEYHWEAIDHWDGAVSTLTRQASALIDQYSKVETIKAVAEALGMHRA
jgi:hypothetical protein